MCQTRPSLPAFANLRCGLWYAPSPDGTCYFKSTDGHTGNWSFSLIRLNLHVALLAAAAGGCFVVDATRRGKTFPVRMHLAFATATGCRLLGLEADEAQLRLPDDAGTYSLHIVTLLSLRKCCPRPDHGAERSALLWCPGCSVKDHTHLGGGCQSGGG